MTVGEEVRQKIMRLYVAGLNLKEIADAAGVSVGTAHNVTTEERTEEIEGMRKCYGIARDKGVRPVDLARLTPLLALMLSKDFNVPKMAKFLDKMAKRGGDDLDGLMDSAVRMGALEASTGMSYEEIVTDYEIKIKAKNDAEAKTQSLLKSVQELERRLAPLSVYERIRRLLEDAGIAIDKLPSFVEFHKILERLGFTPAVATELAKVLSDLNLSPEEAINIIAEVLSRFPSFKSAVIMMKREESELCTACEARRSELLSLDREIGEKKVELKKVTAEVSAKREESELIQQTINEQKGTLQTLDDELATYESIVDNNAPLATLSKLMTHPEVAGDPKVVFATLLRLLDGVYRYCDLKSRSLRHGGSLSKILKDAMGVFSDEIQN